MIRERLFIFNKTHYKIIRFTKNIAKINEEILERLRYEYSVSSHNNNALIGTIIIEPIIPQYINRYYFIAYTTLNYMINI